MPYLQQRLRARVLLSAVLQLYFLQRQHHALLGVGLGLPKACCVPVVLRKGEEHGTRAKNVTGTKARNVEP